MPLFYSLQKHWNSTTGHLSWGRKILSDVLEIWRRTRNTQSIAKVQQQVIKGVLKPLPGAANKGCGIFRSLENIYFDGTVPRTHMSEGGPASLRMYKPENSNFDVSPNPFHSHSSLPWCLCFHAHRGTRHWFETFVFWSFSKSSPRQSYVDFI